jgi:hypothetical protein
LFTFKKTEATRKQKTKPRPELKKKKKNTMQYNARSKLEQVTRSEKTGTDRTRGRDFDAASTR